MTRPLGGNGLFEIMASHSRLSFKSRLLPFEAVADESRPLSADRKTLQVQLSSEGIENICVEEMRHY